MKVKRILTSSIFIIIATLMTTTDSKGPNGYFNYLKNSIMSIFTISPNTLTNWRTSSFARNFNKAIGYAPIVKENDVDALSKLIAKDADLIKIGAFRKLSKLSDTATTVERKKKIILAQLQGTIELIKYYGIKYNCPKVKFTLAQGMYYAYICQKLYRNNDSGECLRKKIQLIASFLFSHKLEVNRFVRLFLNRTKKQAEKIIPGDKLIKFIDTKIACEIKFAQDDKNVLLRTALKMYMGDSKTHKNFNCVAELLKFENDLKEIDSYPGEFHYLVAKAYGNQNIYESALSHLHKAREAKVVDSKTRETNRKVQLYYEKIYTRLYATVK